MLTAEIIHTYLDKVVEGLKADAATKNQKIPQQFRIVAEDESGQLYGADYFKYLVVGRGPGKFPPVDKMRDFVDAHPEMLEDAKKRFKNITRNSLAYLIGRKIATKGTDIYTGKKPGIDMLGVMEANMPDLLRAIVRNEAVKFQTNLHNGINTGNSA